MLNILSYNYFYNENEGPLYEAEIGINCLLRMQKRVTQSSLRTIILSNTCGWD